MTARVVVVGDGVAGLAAAWSARRSGRDVTVVSKGAGASALGGGAVDDVPWEALRWASRLLGQDARATPLAPDVAEFVRELGLWDVPARERVRLATVAGRVRPARGRDRALLDLAKLSGKTVLVARAARPGWDADAITATLAADSLARAERIGFRAADVAVLRLDDEHRIGDADLAARHDDASRRAWLVEQLRTALASCPEAGAILVGPWLGASAPRAEALSSEVGVPVGEALAGAGTPAGLRFEAARDALLFALAVERVRARVERVDPSENGLSVVTTGGDAIGADLVVLAGGGVAGGGVRYAPAEHTAGSDLPAGASVPFELSVRAAVTLAEGGSSPLEMVSSLHGPVLDLRVWPSLSSPSMLETVGVRCQGVRAGEKILAAGDAVAGRPRTILEAVASGIAAGAAEGAP